MINEMAYMQTTEKRMETKKVKGNRQVHRIRRSRKKLSHEIKNKKRQNNKEREANKITVQQEVQN